MPHEIVDQEEWLAARRRLLEKEKQLTRQLDAVAAERRALPWTKVAKSYPFETPEGQATLGDLFKGRSQLIIYHFMMAPGQGAGCPACSFLCDHVDGARQHFEHHDVKFAAVSRAPLAEIETYRSRMGWSFDWVSSNGSDFNYDFHASFRPEDIAAGRASYNFQPIPKERGTMGEAPGFSVFVKEKGGAIFHSYSAYARGGDLMIGAHNFLDLTPKGRNEGPIMSWMRRHDEYDEVAPARS